MTSAQHSDESEPRLRVFRDPAEALRQARPLPAPDEIEIEGIAHEDWEALREAISRS